MVQTLAVTQAMTSLSQAHQLLELSPASDPHFFTDQTDKARHGTWDRRQ